jgi:hypothetical protein
MHRKEGKVHGVRVTVQELRKIEKIYIYRRARYMCVYTTEVWFTYIYTHVCIHIL